MSKPSQFDFWYAIQNTRVVVLPSRRLDTFGATVLNYHMVTELMDDATKIRVREGRVQAHRPQIITPASIASTLLDGFGEEAERYVEWLREHSQDLRMLQYGFVISKQETSEQIVTDSLAAVVERVETDVRRKDDPLAAVVVGVDAPWEVCLIKMMVEISGHSYPGNVRELERHRMFAQQDGIPRGLRDQIEAGFQAAGADQSKINDLGHMLQKNGVFEQYEDRFFALVKTAKRGRR